MRALKFAVGLMGVLIVGATVALIVLVAQRVGGPGAPVSAVLDEPAGTRIASASASGDWMVLHLQGGGADRVVTLDPRTGRVLARVALSR